MTENAKKTINAIIEYWKRKFNITEEEFIQAIKCPADTSIEKYIIDNLLIDIDYTICGIIAHIYDVSISAVYSRWQKNKNVTDFLAFLSEIEKIQTRYKASDAVCYQWYNSFIFNELLTANINKHRVAYIEGDTTHYMNSNSKSYSESLTFYESEEFKGLTMPQLIVYMAIQSILQDNSIHCNNDCSYSITLRRIYEVIYPSRWDKATPAARQQLWQEIRELNYALGKIIKAEYKYKTKKNKYSTDNVSGKNLFGTCRWQMIDFSLLDENAKRNQGEASFIQEKKTNWENCTFVCRKGEMIDWIAKTGRVINLSSNLITTKNVRNNIWVNYYIARHVCLAVNDKNKIAPVILFSTLEKYLGSCSREAIKSIMARYQQLGIIGDFSITAKKIDFSGKEKVKKTAPAKEKITVLRNENKADITPEVIPAEIKEREQKIRSINQFYSAQSVTLDGKTLNTDVRQIFNSDWNKGGRLYGSKNSYQAVKAADRGRIKINGSMTSELDYSSIHINLLYAYACKQAPEDCYGFYPLRKLAKKALLIALNAKSIDSAAKVLSNEWTTKNPDRPLTIEQAKEVIEDAIDAHAPIKQYICSGVGTGLQRIDSELAIEVVEQCKQQGIVALPIHDSFIVADVNKRKLQKIMTAVYTKYTGGFSCPVAEKAS